MEIDEIITLLEKVYSERPDILTRAKTPEHQETLTKHLLESLKCLKWTIDEYKEAKNLMVL